MSLQRNSRDKENEEGRQVTSKRQPKPIVNDSFESGAGLSMLGDAVEDSPPLQMKDGNRMTMAATAQVRPDEKKTSNNASPVISTPLSDSSGMEKFSPDQSKITPKTSKGHKTTGRALLKDALELLREEEKSGGRGGPLLYKRTNDGIQPSTSSSKFGSYPWDYAVVHKDALEALMKKEADWIDLKVANNMLTQEKETLKLELEQLKADKPVPKRLTRVGQNKMIMNLEELKAFDSKLEQNNAHLGQIHDDLIKHGIAMVLESYLGYKFTTDYEVPKLKAMGLLELDTGSVFLRTIRKFSSEKFQESLNEDDSFVDVYKRVRDRHFGNRKNADANFKHHHKGDESKMAIWKQRHDETRDALKGAGKTVHNLQSCKKVADKLKRKADKSKKTDKNKIPKHDASKDENRSAEED